MNREIIDRIRASAESRADEFFGMACRIFDRPELGMKEYFASALIEDELEKLGFTVERGVGGLETAFRATWEQGEGGLAVGFMMEYDALREVDHACGHHLQAPTCIGAAMALRDVCDAPLKLVLYGTPDEENSGGKIPMLKNGCFRDVDIMLCYHSGIKTGVGTANKALLPTRVTFHGRSAHASASPELGRSALDAMMLAFHGLEIMREHVQDGCRIHYTVLEGTGPSNVVPSLAKAHVTLRAPDRRYLEDMAERFRKVIDGACMMTETTADIEFRDMYHNLVISDAFRDTVIALADELELPMISHYRSTSGGSSDVGNVSWAVPTANIYTRFCEGRAHSSDWTDAGKTDEARSSMLWGSELLCASALAVIQDSELLEKIRQEHKTITEEAVK